MRARSTYKTSTGKKRYLKRDAEGRIVDNQSYKNAHGQDVRRKSKAELAKKK
jgi:hypothetical protein